jgi:ubiquinone/menaquinone biosynthesis C-methylase UbiE
VLSSWVLDILRCPETKQKLVPADLGLRRSSDDKFFPDQDGIASLVYPQELVGDDERLNQRYEWLAPYYDVSERILGRLLTGIDMQEGRRHIVDLLGLTQGMRLLEVSPGPGVFQPMLRKALGADSQIAAVDLSLNMLRQCRQQHASECVDLIRANAQHLPFADESFDALFHFGGVNLFNAPELALSEFIRVVRKGGLIAWGDEQMDASFTHPVGRRILPRMNPGFKKIPPPVPCGVAPATKHVVYKGLGYLVVGRKA